MKKNHVTLSEKDKKFLSSFLSKGTQKVREQKRAMALQMLDKGKTYKEVSIDLEISYPTILKWAKNYNTNGLSFLIDKVRSGRPPKFDGSERTKVTALACSQPPVGRNRWTLRLLSDQLVELELIEDISHTQIRRILKKTNCNLIANASGVLES